MALASVMFALVCWILALWNGYRRASRKNKLPGLLMTLAWLALVAPLAHFRMGENITVTALSAATGGIAFGLLSWRRGFDALDGLKDSEEGREEKEAGRWDWIEWAWPITVVIVLTLLALVIFLG